MLRVSLEIILRDLSEKRFDGFYFEGSRSRSAEKKIKQFPESPLGENIMRNVE